MTSGRALHATDPIYRLLTAPRDEYEEQLATTIVWAEAARIRRANMPAGWVEVVDEDEE